MSEVESRATRVFAGYANFIIRHPLAVVFTLLVLGALSAWGATKLTINSNQLDLISQDLREVTDVKRVIDMVGGSGHLIMALRSEEIDKIKAVADDLAATLKADSANVRSVVHRMPTEFVRERMILFAQTEDLLEGKKRINAYIRDQMKRNSPFFFELRKTEPLKLDLSDIIAKYIHLGKKNVSDDYYVSDDKKMVLLLIKPMWDNNQLELTKNLLDKIRAVAATYSQNNKLAANLVEDYDLMGKNGVIAYGFTGSYATNVDDSYAIKNSLEPVSLLAFVSILLITVLFFRKTVPSIIVLSGMVLGTILTMGFTYITIGQLNMITSILGGILMGFGVDYGIHFTFRTRLELGAGKPYDIAIRDALINAGRPALVSAVVTGGSFFVLLASQFRGFSQFGFLAGFGTLIIGVTLFSWSPAILALLGKHWPELPKKLIGTMKPPTAADADGEIRIPRPKLLLGLCTGAVALICAFAVPWTNYIPPKHYTPTMWERFKGGVHFDYNTRALMPDNQPSVKLQDEISERFQISADPLAVYSQTREEAKEIFDEITQHPDKYSNVDQLVSIFSFVPPRKRAEDNHAIMQAWKEELKDLDLSLLPEEYQNNRELIDKIFDAKPYDVDEVPEVYVKQFINLPNSKPENRGWLTFVYPRVDLWEGKNMLAFADQVETITTPSGKIFHAAGGSILYARLARIVLFDGKMALFLTTLWILAMHFLDFRNVKLALASVIPLGVGVLMMLGMLSMINGRLNFMNIIVLSILLGFGVSHGLYLLHRFLEGTSPVVALRSVGAAVASSTLTAIAGFASLFVAAHHGLKSMGLVACLGLATTLVVSFTVLAAVLQIMHDQRQRKKAAVSAPDNQMQSVSDQALGAK